LTSGYGVSYSNHMKIKHVDHIGINVEDLAAAKGFFVDLGFKVMGEMAMQGELVERVIGLDDVKDDIVMLQSPDGQINIELVKFHQPKDPNGIQAAAANTLGLRHLCFQVENLDDILKNLNKKGTKLVGEVQTYENSWKLCYIRGPEEIILELAERLEK
jgi:catechol 2,3-dioxygenase-like lactoylglutathione lyase family enzyme